MINEPRRPYYDRDRAAKRKTERDREVQEKLTRLKIAFLFGKCIVKAPTPATLAVIDALKRSEASHE